LADADAGIELIPGLFHSHQKCLITSVVRRVDGTSSVEWSQTGDGDVILHQTLDAVSARYSGVHIHETGFSPVPYSQLSSQRSDATCFISTSEKATSFEY